MTKIYKAYLYKNLYRDLSRFFRRNMRRIDFNKEHWLHRAGLTTYHPVRTVLSGSALFLCGTLCGAAVALMFAPKTGVELRTEMRDRARRIGSQAQAQLKERMQPAQA